EQPERGRERALAAAPVGRGAAARDVEVVRGDGGAPVERTQQRDDLLRPRQVRERGRRDGRLGDGGEERLERGVGRVEIVADLLALLEVERAVVARVAEPSQPLERSCAR